MQGKFMRSVLIGGAVVGAALSASASPGEERVTYPDEVRVTAPAVTGAAHLFELSRIHDAQRLLRRTPEVQPAPFVNYGGEGVFRSFAPESNSPRIFNKTKFPAFANTGWNPADPSLAVGPSHVVATANSNIAIFNKATGAKVNQHELASFFGGLGATDFIFRPQCVYDPVSDRFIVAALEQDDLNPLSKVLLAVSATGNPAGAWHKYRIEATAVINGRSCWMDALSLGVNQDGILLAGNLYDFSGPFRGVQMIAVRKSTVLSGGSATLHYFRDTATNSFSPVVAESFDLQRSTLHCVNVAPGNKLKLWTFANFTGTPTMATAVVNLASYVTPMANAPSAAGRFLETMDGRLINAALRNGRLFCVHTVAASNDNRNRIRWYEVSVDGTPAVHQTGTVLGEGEDHLHMGAISVNSVGDVATIFTRSSAEVVADVAAAGRYATDPAGAMGPIETLESADGPHYGFAGVNRWGNWVGLTVDPVDQRTFWGIHMTGAANGQWRTSLHRFNVTAAALLESVALSTSDFVGGNTVQGEVRLAAPAASAVTVGLTSSDPALSLPASVTIPAGQAAASFSVSTIGVNNHRQVTIEASLGESTMPTTVWVRRASLDVLTLPSPASGGQQVQGSISFDGRTGPGGRILTFTSSSPVVTPPQSVTVGAQANSAQFTLQTSDVSAETGVTISVTDNIRTRTRLLTVRPGPRLVGVSVWPQTVVGGTTATATVRLTEPAYAGGIVLQLSKDSVALAVPPTTIVPEGQTVGYFTVSTIPLSFTATRTIFATLNGVTRGTSITITPGDLVLTSFTANPTTIQSGNSAVGTVTLTGAAPGGGTVVHLSSGSSAIQVPASVTVPAGSASRTFTIQTSEVGSTFSRQIIATCNGSSRVVTVTLTPSISIASLTLSKSTVKGGESLTGTVTLSLPAPNGGIVVALESGSGAIQVPSSVTVAAGQTSVTFPIQTNPVGASFTRTISAIRNGVRRNANLTLTP
jgi:hypothetical protein